MRIRLTRKLANTIDGVAIADYSVGDIIDLPSREARLLIAEDWAVPVGREIRRSSMSIQAAEAADFPRGSPVNHLRRASRQIDRRRFALPYGRRREDAVVDELRDSRAKTITGTDD